MPTVRQLLVLSNVLTVNSQLRAEFAYVVLVAVGAIVAFCLWCCALTMCCCPRAVRQLLAFLACVLCIGATIGFIVLIPLLQKAMENMSDSGGGVVVPSR